MVIFLSDYIELVPIRKVLNSWYLFICTHRDTQLMFRGKYFQHFFHIIFGGQELFIRNLNRSSSARCYALCYQIHIEFHKIWSLCLELLYDKNAIYQDSTKVHFYTQSWLWLNWESLCFTFLAFECKMINFLDCIFAILKGDKRTEERDLIDFRSWMNLQSQAENNQKVVWLKEENAIKCLSFCKMM